MEKEKLKAEMDEVQANAKTTVEGEGSVKFVANTEKVLASEVVQTKEMKLNSDSQGMWVRVVASDFFKPGAVEPNPDLFPLIKKLGKLVSTLEYPVQVIGHSFGDEDLKLSRFKNHWELSSARAQWILNYWFESGLTSFFQLTVIAAADVKPLADSETDPEWSANKNRRVEILIPRN